MQEFLIFAALAVAFANGANDVFKGFATVWGSATASYRLSLALAVAATIAGGVASIILANGLVGHFSGKGLVPDAVAMDPSFALSAAIGVSATILAATRLGFPVSTTHALVGALVGAGLASGAAVNFDKLFSTFVIPLVFSPIVAAMLAAAGELAVRKLRPPAADCACVTVEPALVQANVASATVGLVVAPTADCDRAASPPLARVTLARAIDGAHIASAVAICFARAVNDTPKIAALLVLSAAFGGVYSSLAVTAAMALGGAFFSRRVAETMSLKINRIDPSQGVIANLVTTGLVLSASVASLPVSTTQVAVGAISGAGGPAGTLNPRALRDVLLSWLATLPCAALIAFAAVMILSAIPAAIR